MTLARVCDECDHRVGDDVRFVAIGPDNHASDFCSVTCLAAWIGKAHPAASIPCAKPEPPQVEESRIGLSKADRDIVVKVAERLTAARSTQDAEMKTCEICGRVGKRRYVETGTGWKCSPTASACSGNRSTTPPLAAAPSEMGVAFQRAEAVKAAPSPGVTARCTDCSRTWILTGRVLQQAIDMHEQKHSHIVQTVDTTDEEEAS